MNTVQELRDLYSGEKKLKYPSSIPVKERIVGAIMGAFIGDALALGCHWIYDYEELWRDFGSWVDDFSDPKAKDEGGSFEMVSKYRYDAGVRAGMSSQTGQLLQVMLETAAAKNPGGANEEAFNQCEYIRRVNHFFEHVLLPEAAFESDIDTYNAHKGVALEQGTFIGARNGIKCFSGRYTNEEVRENFDVWYYGGKKNGRWWHHDSGVTMTSTSEGAQWGVVLATLYRDPEVLFYKAYDFLQMWYCDKAFISMQLMYIMAVQSIINEILLDEYENYHIALCDRLGVIGQQINSFDDIQLFRNVMSFVKREHLFPMADDRFAPIFFGQNCHVASLVPCAYYYALKYSGDFEKGVLTAVNSSGNNMARAALSGALIGAMTGIKGIPDRFVKGLENEKRFIPKTYQSQGEYLLDLAHKVVHKRQEL